MKADLSRTLTKAQGTLLRLVAKEPLGRISTEDKRLDAFSDDGDPDTINQCFAVKWLDWSHDNRTDTGTIWITAAGREALRGAKGGDDA